MSHNSGYEFYKEIKPITRMWHGIKIVKVSTVISKPRFKEWLGGQTMPYVEDDYAPFDWAYYSDYERFINNLPIID